MMKTLYIYNTYCRMNM